jgi:hypothetical protein
MALRQHPESLDAYTKHYLHTEEEWQDLIQYMEHKGIPEASFDHWIWILRGGTADERVERFLSQDTHKPIFLLFYLLDFNFQNQALLGRLIKYSAKWYDGKPAATTDSPYLPGSKRRFLVSNLNMTPSHFTILVRRLVRHCRRLSPYRMPLVADLTATFIRNIQPQEHKPGQALVLQSLVYNKAIQAFSYPAFDRSLFWMPYNWRAQRTLLAVSESMDQHLVVEKESYQAIRNVLLGMKKTPAEADVAVRSSESWPPYRLARDGIEQQRAPEDDYSRVVDAGIMMQEAGDVKVGGDIAIDILAGMAEDGSPTIQQRAGMSKSRRKQYGSKQEIWASAVRATRNAHEAWAIFQQPPEEGLRPHIQVYSEMFEKIVARPADTSFGSLPGDGKETFPFNDANLSEFEKARVQPPSVEELYGRMTADGIKPNDFCLQVLLRSAESVDAGLRYLTDSDLDQTAVARLSPSSTPNYRSVRRIPLPVLSAYIELLCRVQPKRNKNTRNQPIAEHFLRPIRHAVLLAELRLRHIRSEPDNYAQRPWRQILEVLATSEVIISNSDQAHNAVQILSLFTRIFARVKETCGVDMEMVQYFAQAFQLAMRHQLPNILSDLSGDAQRIQNPFAKLFVDRMPSDIMTLEHDLEDDVPSSPQSALQLVLNAHNRIKSTFEQMSGLGSQPDGSATENTLRPSVKYAAPIRAVEIHSYMRALAFVGDFEGMAKLLSWTIHGWDEETLLDVMKVDLKQHQVHLMRTLCAFRAFAEPSLGESVILQLVDSINAQNASGQRTLHWPDEEEVEQYVEWDPNGSSGMLQEVIYLASAYKQQS